MISSTVRPLIGRQYALGHNVIDSDHFAIADWWLRTVTSEPIQFEFFAARLKRLLRIHFDHEALLMQEAGGRMCECHDQEHRLLLSMCDQAITLGHAHFRMARSLLRTKFPKLVREHIISTDQLTVLFINGHGAVADVC